MNDFIIKIVSECSSYKKYKNFIIKVDDQLIVRGLFFEKVGKGYYLWELVFPLFDLAGMFHLSFSRRCDLYPYFRSDEVPDDHVLFSLCRYLNELDVEFLFGLDAFISKYENNPLIAKNNYLSSVVGLANILSGKCEIGRELLTRDCKEYSPQGKVIVDTLCVASKCERVEIILKDLIDKNKKIFKLN